MTLTTLLPGVTNGVPLLGSQEPRICHVPKYVSSAGQEAIELAALAGLNLDPWEALVLTGALGEREDGRWASFEVGVDVPRQNGKGPHSLDTPILTTDGWSTFADIRVGQFVYGSDGKPTRVVACSETYRDERCFEVGFTDGSRLVVGAGHLWRVRRKDSGARWKVLDTATLAESVGHRRADNGRMEFKWRVRCDTAVETPYADLPIDPYLFGYWLGDGTATCASITTGHGDRAWLELRLKEAGATIVSVSTHDHGNAVGLRFRIDAKMRDGFESRCKRLGVWGAKHIPDVYLTASVAQRRALLAGLMDSDGTIALTNRSPQVEFASSYPALAESFMRLARSLGIRVCRKDSATARRDRSRFLWTPTFNPFEMPRKAAKFVAPTSRRHELMSITSIRPVPTVPVRCIQVERDDGVYLVGHYFTPTHNSILEARELAGLFLFGEKLIIHSAHEQATSSEHFQRLLNLIESVPEFERRVLKAPRGKGAEAIKLRGGQRIFFKTRTGGGGRGLTGDLVVLDEAMILPVAVMAALVPTMAARSMVGNPQLWYAGSAVDQQKHEHGVVFARVRERGIKAANAPVGPDTPPSRVAWFEWSAPGDNPDHVPASVAADPLVRAQSNPGLGIRISPQYIEDEAGALPAREFAVERLGVGDWPATDGTADQVITDEAWAALTDVQSELVGSVYLAFDVTPDRSRSAIAAAGRRRDGLGHVELIAHRPGTGWVAERLAELVAAHGAAGVTCDGHGPAGSLIADIEKLGVTVYSVTANEHAQACGVLFDGVGDSSFRHLGDPALAAAVKGAAKRTLGDAWAWSRKSSAVDISPLVAGTLALWKANGEGSSVYEERGLLVLSLND